MHKVLNVLLALSRDEADLSSRTKIIIGMAKKDVSSLISLCMKEDVSGIPDGMLQEILCILLGHIARSRAVELPSAAGPVNDKSIPVVPLQPVSSSTQEDKTKKNIPTVNDTSYVAETTAKLDPDSNDDCKPNIIDLTSDERPAPTELTVSEQPPIAPDTVTQSNEVDATSVAQFAHDNAQLQATQPSQITPHFNGTTSMAYLEYYNRLYNQIARFQPGWTGQQIQNQVIMALRQEEAGRQRHHYHQQQQQQQQQQMQMQGQGQGNPRNLQAPLHQHSPLVQKFHGLPTLPSSGQADAGMETPGQGGMQDGQPQRVRIVQHKAQNPNKRRRQD